MAKTRKTARKAKAKAASTKKKTARKPVAKRTTAKSSRAGTQRAAKPKPVTKKKAVKPVAAKAASAQAKAAKSAAKAQAAAARKRPLVVAAKPKSAKPAQVARKVAVAAEVRPLGVLPPSSMKRSKAKPIAHVNYEPRTIQAKTPPPAQGAERVTDQDIKAFEERLLSERQRILREMGHLENTVLKINQRDSSGDLSGYSFHMADSGTDAMEREKAFLFASSEGRALLEINEALRRLYRGEYGICESCGNPIARARLEAIPQARLCVPCKEKEERAQRGVV